MQLFGLRAERDFGDIKKEIWEASFKVLLHYDGISDTDYGEICEYNQYHAVTTKEGKEILERSSEEKKKEISLVLEFLRLKSEEIMIRREQPEKVSKSRINIQKGTQSLEAHSESSESPEVTEVSLKSS